LDSWEVLLYECRIPFILVVLQTSSIL